MNSARTRARWLVLFTALLAIGALSLPAVVGADSLNKQFTVALSTNPAPPNSNGVIVRALFTNNTANQTIGSAQLVVPTGLTVTGASVEGCPTTPTSCTVSINGNTVTYGSLNNGAGIPTNGGTETLDVTVSTPLSCGPDSNTFTAHAHQANDFNSAGNVFSPDPTTVTIAGCYTATISPPAVTPSTNTTPSTTVYTLTITNSPSSSPFTINSATITVPSGFTGVSVGSPSSLSGGTWTASGTQTVTLSNSTGALQPGQSVSVPITATAPTATGTYTWTTAASNSNSGTSAQLSGSQPSVDVADSVVPCPVGGCSSPLLTTTTGPETQVQVTANPGTQPDTLATDLPDPVVTKMCQGQGQDQTHFGQIVYWNIQTRSTVLVYTIVAVAHYKYGTADTCFGQPKEFTTANGTPAPFYGPPNNEFEGTIPLCSSKNPPPCVASIQADEFGFAFGEISGHTVTFTIDKSTDWGRYGG